MNYLEMNTEINNIFYAFGIGSFLLIISILLIWSLIWKGIALWKAAKSDSKVWFIVLLIVNTFGILDILYIYIFSKKAILKRQYNHHTK